MSKWNCWLCGKKRVPSLPNGCVPEVGDPKDNYSPLPDSTMCPGCACSNPDDVLDCSRCGAGIAVLTGYNPFVERILKRLDAPGSPAGAGGRGT